ncbi:phospholipid-transporting ATPase ABCA3-like [Orycteropus afer afer]|uniref:Phospholipid-transporting ATPase ABCA3-like n=1 Tax=Orycteropus afer afer TaxID=1230840 RepID=A0A8B7B9V2_ORYAF|nr:phospholipid-transporting ATPase ABCA3-like [Orycteropus afer afer]
MSAKQQTGKLLKSPAWKLCSLYYQQFRAMFIKRALFSWRNWKLMLLQILGLLGVVIFLLKAENFVTENDDIARQMNLREYGQTIVPLAISGNSSLTVNLSKHLENMLKSEKQILQEVRGDIQNYLMGNKDCIHLCIVALSIEVKTNETVLTVLFNNEAYHSPSVSLAVLDNILFKSLSGPDASITVSNKPQPYHDYISMFNKHTSGMLVSLYVHFGMGLLISGFCLLSVTERVTKAKHIQFVSGIYVLIYWFSALLWDFITLFISCCLLLVIFKYCNVDVFVMDYHFLDIMMIFVLYGWSTIPLMYLLSFLFSKSTTAYIKLILFNYLSGIFSLYVDTAVRYMEIESIKSTVTRNSILNSLLLLPNYNLLKCLSGYFAFYNKKISCNNQRNHPDSSLCNTEDSVYSLEDDMIGKNLFAMGTTGFAFLLLIFSGDTRWWWKLKKNFIQYVYFAIYKKFNKELVSKELSGRSEDEDVEQERKRILDQSDDLLMATVLIKELIKIYFNCPAILAVKNISLTIQKGECFGLLGYNGAGKTTTFQMLTGEKIATSGDMFIEGFSITNNILKVRSRIGYCPQQDALLEYMTGRETLIMYARIWGVSEHQIHLYVNHWLSSLHLESHADKLIYTYSGGNKRRVSTAIALMGKPSVVFLDEPSTGMDPIARRLVWNLVTKIRETGKAIVITSHSMEECEALCTRLAIMVKGKFVCLGSPQHLKNKFGHFYILKVKVKPDTDKDALEDFKSFISMTFPGSVIKQENQRIVNYYIPSKDNSWAKVFGILEEAKEQFHLEDYSISQITLEQVFLAFAHTDKMEDESEENIP